MSADFISEFGWIPSSDEKRELHETRYSFNLFFPIIRAQAIEYVFPYDNRFITWFNQKGNSCVGFSLSQYQAIVNMQDNMGALQYDGWWLYVEAARIDQDPQTDPEKGKDNGTYLWAGGDILRKIGHKVKGTNAPDLTHGIQSYYWIKSADEARTAFGLRRPLEFGLPWYQGWMTPVQKNGEYWLPERAKWKSPVGGHAICADAISDQRQAVRLRNTWGTQYPPVWMKYADMEYLLSQKFGECMVAIDVETAPPPPPPTPTSEHVNLNLKRASDGKLFYGRLEEK